MAGYIKLWRKIEQSEIWESDPFDLQLFLWILLHAAYKQTEPGHKRLALEPGELLTSYSTLQKIFTRPGHGFRKRYVPTIDFLRCSMHRLCDFYVVSKHRATPQGGLLVKVLHWEEYQQTEDTYATDYAPHQPRTNPAYAPLNKKVKKEEERSLGQKQRGNGHADESFTEFWKLYPRKVKRPEAMAAFAKATEKKKVPAETIMAGLRMYLPLWKGKDKEWLPYPATWLNNEQWADEIDIPKSALESCDELYPLYEPKEEPTW